MKKSIWNLLIPGLLAAGLSFHQTGCSSNNSPSNPSNNGAANTPTFTPTATSTPVLAIQGISLQHMYQYNAPGYQYSNQVYLQLGGQPVTTAAVTLTSTGAGVTLAIPYSGPVTSVQVYSGYSNAVSYNYVAGQNYVVSATASGQTAALTLTAPGGSFNFLQDNNGAVTQATWGLAGNQDFINLGCNSPATQTLSASPTSGTSFNIPDNGVSNAYAAPGSLYNLAVQVGNYNAAPPLGAVIFDFYRDNPVTVTDIIWENPAFLFSYDADTGITSYHYQVGLNVQGTTPTTAAVTLSDITAAATHVLNYSANYASGGVSYGQYYYQGSTGSYSAGNTYVLTTATSAGTASATLVAPGGISSILQNSSSNAITQISWTVPGTSSNAVSMNETYPSSTPYVFSNAVSPLNISTGFYTGGHLSTYQAVAIFYSTATAITNGLYAPNGNNGFIGQETYSQTITIN